MSIDGKACYAAAAFAVLLILSVFWPEPVVSVNQLWLHRDLGVDELSFLGREAPSWDVVFWCIVGLFALAIAQSAEAGIGEIRARLRELRAMRLVVPRRITLFAIASLLIIAGTWLALDKPLVAFAEAIQSDAIENFIRMMNRLGGGMNPPMIVLFFVIAGLAYRRRKWVDHGVAMAIAGLSAGIFAQIVKFAVGRTRPELWVGPFHYARASASSFPSGHTVGAFALAGVLMLSAESKMLRVAAGVLALCVAVARVLAFRHWPSDVVASALIGLLAAWIAYASTSAKLTETSREQPASSIVTP